jgi:polyisoprenoid-binding protein YceI
MRILLFLAGAVIFGAGAVAGHVLLAAPPPAAREAPPPPPPDRTPEVLEEISAVREALKAFAGAVDAAAEERAALELRATAIQGALAELKEATTALSRRQDDLAAALAARPAEPPPPPAAAEPEPPPAPAATPEEPPAPAAPSTPKRKSLAELLAAKKRVDPRDQLTRYRLLEGHCNVGFDGVSTVHNFTGQSRKAAGEFALHVNDLADQPSGRLAVPVATLDTGDADRDADMRKYLGGPEIVCELLGFTPEKEARVRFTINGKAHETTAKATLEFDRGLLHVKGETKLRMSDFEIKVKAAALGMIKVEDEVTAWWDLYAEVQRDAPR